jgi:hypothetical protein
VFSDDLLLPEKGVLLHIGPHKTGTTTIQGALKLARPEMAKVGVVYAGQTRQHQMAALALTGGNGLTGDRPAEQADWDLLVSQVRAAADRRVIVSSEFFDECTDEMARTVIRDFGPDRVHVVVTLRPLAKIMPSAWQQYVRNGLRRPYDEWLDGILLKPPYDKPSPSFWRRHHHELLVERWVSLLGADRVVVVVLDESDPNSLMRTFERLVGLPEGMLVPETGWDNRSLTAAETELVRSMNVLFQARKWPPAVYNRVIRLGLIKQMQRRKASRDEPGIFTPKWAIDRANEIAAQASERIVATGVRIVGDLAWLSAVEPKDSEGDPTLTIEAATAALVGTIVATGVVPAKKTGGPKPPPHKTAAPSTAPVNHPMRDLDEIGTRELAAALRSRLIEKYRARRAR